MKLNSIKLAMILTAASLTSSQAAIVVAIDQNGADVVATMTGSFNLDVFTFNNGSVGTHAQVRDNLGVSLIGTGKDNGATILQYQGAVQSGTGSIFSSRGNSDADSTDFGGNNTFYFDNLGSPDSIYFNDSYVSGTDIGTITITWKTKTLTELDLIEGSSDTVTYTNPNDSTSDTIAFSVGSSSVPEPSGILLLGVSVLAGLGIRRRK